MTRLWNMKTEMKSIADGKKLQRELQNSNNPKLLQTNKTYKRIKTRSATKVTHKMQIRQPSSGHSMNGPHKKKLKHDYLLI